MRGIKYGFSFFCKNIWSNLFIALEIALLIIASNALLGFYNNLSFLYYPYEDIISNDGVLYTDGSVTSKNPEENLNRTPMFDLLGRLKGETEIYFSYTYPYNDDKGNGLLIHIIDDRIFDRFYYATVSGSFEKGCAVASNMSGYSVGDYVKYGSGEVRISGVLTETSYYPLINPCEDVNGLYIPFTSGVDDAEFIIMSISSAEKLFGKLHPSYMSDTILISYKDCSAKDIEYNNSLLKENGEYWELEPINNRSVTKLKEQYARFVPFIYIISIAVIIGIISFCIVTSLDNKADMDILYNCGAGSISLFFVMLGKNLCIVISSVLFSAIALLFMNFTGVFANNGIRLMDNLLPCSALIIAACIVMCQLVSTLSNLTFWRKVK